MAEAMQVTPIHLKPTQKRALQVRAQTNNTNVAEEVRRAVDAYLTGIDANELALLDQATRQAQVMLDDMRRTLVATNDHLRTVFAERDRLRKAAR